MESLSQAWHSVLAALAAAHPAVIFLSLALLPLVGVPASPLIIACGARFGSGVGFMVAYAALLLNSVLGYGIARWWLRAPVARWIGKRGHAIPRLDEQDEVQFILLMRITPGMPLTIRNYIMGLAEVNFVRYLYISLPIQAAYAFVCVSFGQSLKDPRKWGIILAVTAGIAAYLIVKLARRHLARRRDLTVPPK